MKQNFYLLLLIIFPVIAVAEGISVVGGPINTQAILAQVEQAKDQLVQLKNNDSLEPLKQKLDKQQNKDARNFCYFADKAYSEGSHNAGKTCVRNERERGMMVFKDEEKVLPPPLIWK